MGKSYWRRPLKHGVSTHPTFKPVYWAEVEIVDETGSVAHRINRDSSLSEADAAKEAVDAANAWIAAQSGRQVTTIK